MRCIDERKMIENDLKVNRLSVRLERFYWGIVWGMQPRIDHKDGCDGRPDPDGDSGNCDCGPLSWRQGYRSRCYYYDENVEIGTICDC